MKLPVGKGLVLFLPSVVDVQEDLVDVQVEEVSIVKAVEEEDSKK
jgi:hypothetical protein